MSENLTTVSHEQFGSLRVTDHDGNPWFVARDVAKALGYKDLSDAVRTNCKKACKITQQGPQPFSPPINFLIIPESDLYRLIMHSKLPAAERFQDWVCEDVLPSIRKKGFYSTLEQKFLDTAKQLEDTTKLLETANQSLDLGRQYYRDLNFKFKKLEYSHRMLDFKVKGYGNRLTIRRYLGLNGMSCYNLEYELIYDPRPIVQFLQQKTYKDQDWSLDYASPESKKLSVHFTPHVLCFYHDDIMLMAQQLKEQALAQALAKAQKGSL